jgi:retron-type reverse transcriptase
MVDGKISNSFLIDIGVRQGDGLSAALFNLFLHKALKKLEQSNAILNRLTQICRYADDILVIAGSLPALEALCVELSRKAGRVGLVVSPERTKYMNFSASPSRRLKKRSNHRWCNLRNSGRVYILGYSQK